MKFNARGNNIGGGTDNQQMRSWIYGYLAGAGSVFQEASGMTHFYAIGGSPKKLGLTSTGQTAREAADFCFRRCPDRGEPYQPMGILMEHEHGFDPAFHGELLGQGPWYKLKPSEGEWAIKAFWEAVYPGHSRQPDPALLPKKTTPMDKEPTCHHGSVLGDAFDVLTDRAPIEILRRYPRVMLLGGIRLNRQSLKKLKDYVARGGEAMINAAHLSASVHADNFFGVKFGRWTSSSLNQRAISVCTLKPVTAHVLSADAGGNPLITENKFGKGKVILIATRHALAGAPISRQSTWLPEITAFLQQWIQAVYPVQVDGLALGLRPHVALNKLRRGWLVTIGNHYRNNLSVKVTLRMGKVREVKELWKQKQAHCKKTGDYAEFQTTIPAYSFRVFRVLLDK